MAMSKKSLELLDKMNQPEKIWLLYDGRYLSNPDKATCFEMCTSLEEARGNKDDYGSDTVIVEADTIGDNIVNQKIVN